MNNKIRILARCRIKRVVNLELGNLFRYLYQAEYPVYYLSDLALSLLGFSTPEMIAEEGYYMTRNGLEFVPVVGDAGIFELLEPDHHVGYMLSSSFTSIEEAGFSAEGYYYEEYEVEDPDGPIDWNHSEPGDPTYPGDWIDTILKPQTLAIKQSTQCIICPRPRVVLIRIFNT